MDYSNLPKEYFHIWKCSQCQTFNSIQNVLICKSCSKSNPFFIFNPHLAQVFTALVTTHIPTGNQPVLVPPSRPLQQQQSLPVLSSQQPQSTPVLPPQQPQPQPQPQPISPKIQQLTSQIQLLEQQLKSQREKSLVQQGLSQGLTFHQQRAQIPPPSLSQVRAPPTYPVHPQLQVKTHQPIFDLEPPIDPARAIPHTTKSPQAEILGPINEDQKPPSMRTLQDYLAVKKTKPSIEAKAPAKIVSQNREALDDIPVSTPGKTSWDCPRCTFSNQILANKCEICEAPRPTYSQNNDEPPLNSSVSMNLSSAPIPTSSFPSISTTCLLCSRPYTGEVKKNSPIICDDCTTVKRKPKKISGSESLGLPKSGKQVSSLPEDLFLSPDSEEVKLAKQKTIALINAEIEREIFHGKQDDPVEVIQNMQSKTKIRVTEEEFRNASKFTWRCTQCGVKNSSGRDMCGSCRGRTYHTWRLRLKKGLEKLNIKDEN